jgi:hypothetical protein
MQPSRIGTDEFSILTYWSNLLFFGHCVQCISFRVVLWFGSWHWTKDDRPSPEKGNHCSRHRWTLKCQWSLYHCIQTLLPFSWRWCVMIRLLIMKCCSVSLKQRCYWTERLPTLLLCTSNQCFNHFKHCPCMSLCVPCSPSCRRNASLKEWNWRNRIFCVHLHPWIMLVTMRHVMIPLNTGHVYALVYVRCHFQFHFHEWPCYFFEWREAKCNHGGRFYSSVCVLTILGRADNILKKNSRYCGWLLFFRWKKNIFINVCSSWLSVS